MRTRLAVPLLVALAAIPLPASAQDPFSGGGPGGADAPDPGATDASTPLYLKALDLQRKGKYQAAQRAFREVIERFPESVHREDCEARGGDNAYLGCVKIHESGPPARRIDVSVMGDGFQIAPDGQKKEEDWAKLCLTVLWSEPVYEEYKDYFNYYYVRLASKDEGVDKVETEEEKAAREEKNKRRAKKKKPQEFNTALDCKRAGPQGQVMADRDLVYHWLHYADREVTGCADDGLVIAFAQFGVLGMGGGGIANVGRPDKSVTVHEFGHAFVQLLDEYAVNPNPPPPGFPIRAANATSDRNSIPWQHFLDKKVKGVDVLEGGATYQKGVWRPAPSCAMNAAGATGYCPVCREAAVLRIYNYLSPIDITSPAPDTETKVVEGDGSTIAVTPMQPRTHDLKAEWYVDRIPDSEPGPGSRPKDSGAGRTSDMPSFGGYTGGMRGFGRDGAFYGILPLGEKSDLARVERKKGEPTRFVLPISKLGPGRYTVTVRVWDPIDWVLKDDQRLLEERATWWVTVAPKQS